MMDDNTNGVSDSGEWKSIWDSESTVKDKVSERTYVSIARPGQTAFVSYPIETRPERAACARCMSSI
jgi:hypothetical protein